MIKIFGVALVSAASLAALKTAASAAGHEIVTDETDAVDTAFHTLTTAFPALTADIKQGITDLKSSALSGGDRAVKVAEDVIKTLPDVVAALPTLKSVIVSGVTKLFSATETAIEDGLDTFVKTVEGAAPAPAASSTATAAATA